MNPNSTAHLFAPEQDPLGIRAEAYVFWVAAAAARGRGMRCSGLLPAHMPAVKADARDELSVIADLADFPPIKARALAALTDACVRERAETEAAAS